jgi:hypothetical protein
MELQRAIRNGDLDGLRKLEHQILEHVNHVYEDAGNGNDDYENFSLYWITDQEDKKLALEMFMIFVNTCETALGDYFHEYMEVMAYPAMVGAVCRKNQAIIDILKTFLDDDLYMDIVYTFN